MSVEPGPSGGKTWLIVGLTLLGIVILGSVLVFWFNNRGPIDMTEACGRLRNAAAEARKADGSVYVVDAFKEDSFQAEASAVGRDLEGTTFTGFHDDVRALAFGDLGELSNVSAVCESFGGPLAPEYEQ